jgi:hypothetical protein
MRYKYTYIFRIPASHVGPRAIIARLYRLGQANLGGAWTHACRRVGAKFRKNVAALGGFDNVHAILNGIPNPHP